MLLETSFPAVVHVLIAEDDPMVASIHSHLIREVGGFTIEAAVSDGLEVLHFFSKKSADLIVMDIFMPRLSGLDALKELRQQGKTVDAILVSAGKRMELVDQARVLGVFDYMIKPYSMKRFKASLESYLEHRKSIPPLGAETDQKTLDALFEISAAEGDDKSGMQRFPKGIQGETLALVIRALSSFKRASASEVGAALSISRSTARRYLEHLCRTGAAKVTIEYRSAGRPVKQYSGTGRDRGDRNG